ncbi:MAG: hypothetical protein HYR91_07175 [Flavobacteriia bacterium]|nr:hypothetical protein [Flavobacteriia bacterium]
MGYFQRKIANFKEELRIVVTNPDNFEVKWTITSSKIRIYSLVLLIFITGSILLSCLIIYNPFLNHSNNNDTSFVRIKLEKQYKEIKKLTLKVKQQEDYIINVKKVILGKIVVDSMMQIKAEDYQLHIPTMENKLTENEKKIAEKVKEDMKSNSAK